jgi:hypothetical protein
MLTDDASSLLLSSTGSVKGNANANPQRVFNGQRHIVPRFLLCIVYRFSLPSGFVHVNLISPKIMTPFVYSRTDA